MSLKPALSTWLLPLTLIFSGCGEDQPAPAPQEESRPKTKAMPPAKPKPTPTKATPAPKKPTANTTKTPAPGKPAMKPTKVTAPAKHVGTPPKKAQSPTPATAPPVKKPGPVTKATQTKTPPKPKTAPAKLRVTKDKIAAAAPTKRVVVVKPPAEAQPAKPLRPVLPKTPGHDPLADAALTRKIAPYLKCLKTTAKDVQRGKRRYFTWVNAKTGPTGRERHVYGLYRLHAHFITRCAKGINEARSLPPARQELEALAVAYELALK